MVYRSLLSFGQNFIPQSAPLPGMSRNNAGGYSYQVTDWERLQRFLILGSEQGTYYASAQALTRENATAIERCIQQDGLRTVKSVTDISVSGRAPKNDPALFVLAMCAGLGSVETRQAALAALPKIARTGTHLFHFVDYVQMFRGWGRGLRRAISRWYLDMPLERLCLQLVKYRQRDGWSHRDLLRLAHPKTTDTARRDLLGWCVNPDQQDRHQDMCQQYRLIEGMQKVTECDTAQVANIIRQYSLPRELIPTQYLNDQEVWNALLEDMPMTAMIRNLGKMSAVGLLTPGAAATTYVADCLRTQTLLQKARIHPMVLLFAQRTYVSGRGIKGQLSWSPVPQVIDALDEAFYLSFQNVATTGTKIMLALDISGSMEQNIMGTRLTAREASAAMALVTAAREPATHIVGFSSSSGYQPGLIDLPISARQRLDDVLKSTNAYPFGGTDCALPMLHALKQGLEIETFVIYTDNETWHGQIHPVTALQQYRERTGIPAKLCVVGMTSGGFSIADPNDSGMLDIVGFDSASPALMSHFMTDQPQAN